MKAYSFVTLEDFRKWYISEPRNTARLSIIYCDLPIISVEMGDGEMVIHSKQGSVTVDRLYDWVVESCKSIWSPPKVEPKPVVVRNKRQMYQMLRAGKFGHTLPSAETQEEFHTLYNKYGGLWAIRNKKANSDCQFHLDLRQVQDQLWGKDWGDYNVSPMLADDHRVCYGHLFERWDLLSSPDARVCRLLESRDGCSQERRTGIACREYLRFLMDNQGWETLEHLLDTYPEHVIEFTIMTSSLHAFGPSNTIFWEVRTTTGEYERETFGELRRVSPVHA